jgi:FkbM family methyltransferase
MRKFGYELRRYEPASSESALLMTILKHHRVNLVFDVGANTGGYGRHLRGIGYKGRIVSFEPMKDAHAALLAATKNDRLWRAATRSAIGANDGEIEMNVAANSESSSILEMLDAHSAAAPESTYIGVEKVPLRKLDTLASEFLEESSVLFIKIDTQGYEEQVLLGGANTVTRAAVLQLELSLLDLYAGQKLMPEMVEKLKTIGFDLWGMLPVFADPRNGRILQVDGIFCRTL